MYTHISGGGINLQIFSLAFLYNEHRHFRNCWSRSNDGFDLAKYSYTTVYLPPHPTLDYVFFWDPDLQKITPQDYYRMHPTRLMCTQNTRFIRSMQSGNHKTRKVKIKPPANLTSQWRFFNQFCDFPLFVWGMTLINWDEIFWRTSSFFIPIVEISAYYRANTQSSWTASQLAYSPLIDTGVGNEIGIDWEPASSTTPSQSWDYTLQPFTKDLPYWYSTWGQNPSWDFNVKNTQGSSYNTPWALIYWPTYTSTDITGTTALPKKSPVMWTMKATELNKIARMGYFVMSSFNGRCNIPFIYSSHWTWGGTQLNHAPITLLNPCTNQVSVKDPAIVANYLIRPEDTNSGLLTEKALRRFLRPSEDTDERRPEPYEERPTWDAGSESYDETGSEAEESETEQEKDVGIEETLRSIKRKLLREQSERRRINKFFNSLLK